MRAPSTHQERGSLTPFLNPRFDRLWRNALNPRHGQQPSNSFSRALPVFDLAWHNICHRLSPSCNREPLPLAHFAEDLGELGLGVKGPNLCVSALMNRHILSNLAFCEPTSIQTSLFNRHSSRKIPA